MSYEPDEILRLTRLHLERAPGLTRAEVASLVGIDRHTLAGGLRRAGTNFDDVRSEVRATTLARIRGGDRILSAKELATALGFSSARAFRRWLANQ